MDLDTALLPRLRGGEPTLVIGAVPELPGGVAALRVACDDPSTTHGPLERARARIDALLEDEPALGRARERLASSLRRRLLADTQWQPADVRFVEACNRLASRAEGRVALVLDAVDAATPETHRTLARILRERGRLRLPLVLVLRDEKAPLSPALTELLDAMRSHYPGSIVVVPHARDARGAHASRARAGRLPVPGVGAAPEEVGEKPERVEEAAEAANDRATGPLPATVLRVLRAAAVVGKTFEVETVAELLDMSAEDVLEALQLAADAGVPVVDRGGGTLAMPEDLAAGLVASVLPSLRARWHDKIARIVGVPAAPAPATPASAASARAPERSEPDAMRAATHLASAARPADAADAQLEAVSTLTRKGDVARAAVALEKAMLLVDALPPSRKRAELSARATLERARLRWLGVGVDPSFSLRGALDEAFAARAALGPDAPSGLVADALATIVGVACDLGDRATVKRAEDVLVDGIRALLEAGAVMDAASLLNEHAALALRMGNVEGAGRLLRQSRDLFEARVREASGDEHARAELADTYHLLARLPLHAQTAAAGDTEGALESARAAEAAYRALGLRRDVARVWETMARLEMARGNLDRARAHYAAALRIEDAAADLTGLARTTAGLAEVLAKSGDAKQALDLLASSIELNRERGSAMGLTFDGRVLGAIERAIAPADEALREDLERTRARLAEALARPGDADARLDPAGAS